MAARGTWASLAVVRLTTLWDETAAEAWRHQRMDMVSSVLIEWLSSWVRSGGVKIVFEMRQVMYRQNAICAARLQSWML